MLGLAMWMFGFVDGGYCFVWMVWSGVSWFGLLTSYVVGFRSWWFFSCVWGMLLVIMLFCLGLLFWLGATLGMFGGCLGLFVLLWFGGLLV